MGFTPTTPQKAAGCLTDPAVSVPIVTNAEPAATAAADPPDEPPGDLAESDPAEEADVGLLVQGCPDSLDVSLGRLFQPGKQVVRRDGGLGAELASDVLDVLSTIEVDVDPVPGIDDLEQRVAPPHRFDVPRVHLDLP